MEKKLTFEISEDKLKFALIEAISTLINDGYDNVVSNILKEEIREKNGEIRVALRSIFVESLKDEEIKNRILENIKNSLGKVF